MAEDKYWPKPQCETNCDKRDANPTSRVAVDGQEADPICISWHDCQQNGQESERDKNPAVGAILALAAAEICWREKRDD
jgi:hypothetical protein